jgi:hypothetical protein
MVNRKLGTVVHPLLNSSEVAFKGNFRPVKLAPKNPLISEEAMLCAQLFTNTTGVTLQQVISETLLYWWDNEGSYTVSAMEQKIN